MIRTRGGVPGRRADSGTKAASLARRYPDGGPVVPSAWDACRLDVCIPRGERSRGWPRPGRVCPVSSQFNRREVLGACGVAGAAAAAATWGPAQSARGDHVELGRFVKRAGVQGKMTGAQAVAAALACECAACVFGIPGAQNNEFWDALKARGVPYLLVAHEASASVMADAAARATGVVGVFSVVPGPGLTNALTGIGEALHDGIPIVGIISDIDRSPHAKIGQVHGRANAAILRPVVKGLFEVRHQAEIPQAIFQACQIAVSGEPGPVGVVIPYPLLTEVWNFSLPVPPPSPPPFDE